MSCRLDHREHEQISLHACEPRVESQLQLTTHKRSHGKRRNGGDLLPCEKGKCKNHHWKQRHLPSHPDSKQRAICSGRLLTAPPLARLPQAHTHQHTRTHTRGHSFFTVCHLYLTRFLNWMPAWVRRCSGYPPLLTNLSSSVAQPSCACMEFRYCSAEEGGGRQQGSPGSGKPHMGQHLMRGFTRASHNRNPYREGPRHPMRAHGKGNTQKQTRAASVCVSNGSLAVSPALSFLARCGRGPMHDGGMRGSHVLLKTKVPHPVVYPPAWAKRSVSSNGPRPAGSVPRLA